MNNPTLEKMFEIWDTDWHYEVGPDRDGLDMIEIRYYEGTNKLSLVRMAFDKNTAALMAKALLELI